MLKLVLKLPPSVNRSLIYNPRIHSFIHTQEAREYLENESWTVKQFVMNNKKVLTEPFCDYWPIHLYFFLGRKNADSHNYKKILFDCLQQGGLYSNDCYILDKTESVAIDPKNPRVEIWIPEKHYVRKFKDK